MATKNTPTKLRDLGRAFKIVNLRQLARTSGLNYHKLRNCIAGEYGSWTDQEKTKLYNALRKEVEKSCVALGFSYEGRPIVEKESEV